MLGGSLVHLDALKMEVGRIGNRLGDSQGLSRPRHPAAILAHIAVGQTGDVVKSGRGGGGLNGGDAFVGIRAEGQLPLHTLRQGHHPPQLDRIHNLI